MATILWIIMSTCLWNDLNAFKINSSDILFHSSSIAVLSEPIFQWKVTCVLFSKMPHIETPIILEIFLGLVWFEH